MECPCIQIGWYPIDGYVRQAEYHMFVIKSQGMAVLEVGTLSGRARERLGHHIDSAKGKGELLREEEDVGRREEYWKIRKQGDLLTVYSC